MLTKATFFALLFMVLISLRLNAQSCLPNGITFTTQGQIDSFSINYPGCTAIEGDVTIHSGSSISNLDGLSVLTSIGGYFDIESNTSLMNIDGLSNLITVGGDMKLLNNDALTNVAGLSSLTSINGDLSISGNDALANIAGLSNLTSLGGDFIIFDNSSLTNVNVLSGLTSVGGDLGIKFNDFLTNIDGLSNITSIGGDVTFAGNDALMNVDGISNVTSIGGSLKIVANLALTNVDGLSGLTTIGGNLQIYSNGALTNLDGLSNLTTISGDLDMKYNNVLTDCCGIHDLLASSGVGGYIDIYDNPSECSSEAEILSACGLKMSIESFAPCLGADNGALQITVTGYDTIPFFYSWENVTTGQTGSGSSPENVFSIDGLSAGTYNLTVTTSTPDTVIQQGFLLNEIIGSIFEIIEITTTNSSNGLSNGSISLVVNGGTPPYTYNWSGAASGSQSNVPVTSFTIPNLAQGEYTITVSDDAGHQQSVSVSLLDETVPVFPCTQPMDIVILNDVSASVDATEYAESKQFFVDFLEAANIGTGADESQAAIVEWSGADEQAVKIDMTGELSALQNYINSQRAFEWGTSPQEAMDFGKNYLLTHGRPDVAKVLVLSTDGYEGQITPSLIAQADELKAAGFHIVTIAFDDAFAESETRNILTKVASIPQLAPGAPAYSQLDSNLAQNIVNLYLCPIDPGSTATAYFNRDGAIDILDLVPIGNCPYPDGVEITFSIEALRELSLPSGTPVTFYYNDPDLFGATEIMTWLMPCALPAGESDTFTIVLPVTGPSNIFAVLNDDGSTSPPVQFPVTQIDEIAYSNNIDNQSVCLDNQATLQAFKHTTTPIPICDTLVIYTIDVCNISTYDAFDVTVTDQPPTGFVLVNTVFNNNGCATENNGQYDIPAGCCISLTLTYDAANAPLGYYPVQDVHLSGPSNQSYIDFDGSNTTDEDVVFDGNLDCPSSTIEFSKEVNVTESCDDAFLVYKFTINNEMNIPLQGLVFTDVLPSPCTWTYQPYLQEGLSIGNATITGNTATFVIDEVQPNTVATFYMDAALNIWPGDGILTNTATLANVPDVVNGGVKTLTSNSVSTTITASPVIVLPDTIVVSVTTGEVSLDAQISTGTIAWTTSGDGTFSDSTQSATTYQLGVQDSIKREVHLFVSTKDDCHESGKGVVLLLEECALTLDTITVGDCDNNGTADDATDDTYLVTFNVSAVNPGASAGYTVTAGADTLGPFAYGSEGSITLPADGQEYVLTFTDADLSDCLTEKIVIQQSCSFECELTIDTFAIGGCDNHGTTDDSSDDTYWVVFSVASTNPDTNATYSVIAGAKSYGSFVYQVVQQITLPADGLDYELIFTDDEYSDCTTRQSVNRDGCSDFFVPNVFSPNGDEVNDFFKILSKDNAVKIRTCRIFDRWGNMVYFSEDDNSFRWDGRYKGKELEAGVYIYAIEYQTIGDETIKMVKGDVTLVR